MRSRAHARKKRRLRLILFKDLFFDMGENLDWDTFLPLRLEEEEILK